MKRLLNDHRAWPKRSNPYRIAADEHVGDEPGAEYFLDGRDTASIAQLHIDEHQVWSASSGSGHRISFGGLNRAYGIVTLTELWWSDGRKQPIK
jgi:hypothetical protein